MPKLPLPWFWVGGNLLLAVIPVILGYALAWLVRKRFASRAMLVALAVPLGLLWLAFVPNACYLLTEWRHLLFDSRWEGMLSMGRYSHVALFQTARVAFFFLLYSASGVLMFVLAVRPMEHWLQSIGKRPYLFAPFFFFLVALGVYLGLIVRLNSWDLLKAPAVVWDAIAKGLTNRRVVEAILIFAAMLWGTYEAADLWVDGMVERLQRWKLLPSSGTSGGGPNRGGSGKAGRKR